MAKLGLVTVLYNSDEVLFDFFESLSIQSYQNYHLYIIDNSPSDTTDKIIAELGAKFGVEHVITHIKNKNNDGVARGNNQGITLAIHSGCEFVLLLNNDIKISQPHLLEKLINCAINENQSLIVPKILYHDTRIIWMAGGDILKYRGYTSHRGENDEDSEKYNLDGYYNYSPTCFMLINKSVFETVGLMDESYFVYYDDTDFIARCLKYKYKIFLKAELEVYHKVAISTGGGSSNFSIYYQNRNRIYFIKKNYNIAVQSIALTYTIVTRLIRYFMYDKSQKEVLKKAMIDGFKM
ncbi:glycosyltransferase family 2 protein [Pedobacter sp. N23S346]|uniref:glycosyltransferase family 2 protein n=1 Tax=Pedobacter sp. N23S346 TaxID=3402750 RepID=UPI003AD59411